MWTGLGFNFHFQSGWLLLSLNWIVDLQEDADTFLKFLNRKLKISTFQLQTEPGEGGSEWERRVVVCDRMGASTSLTYPCWYSITSLDNDTLYDIKVTANNIHGSSLSSKVHSFYVSTGRSGLEEDNSGQTDSGARGEFEIIGLFPCRVEIYYCFDNSSSVFLLKSAEAEPE